MDRPDGRSRAAAVVIAAASMLVTAATVRANNVVGAWLSPTSNNWPLIAIHAALTPDGRVLSYGTDGVPRQTGYFIYDIWDPTQPLASGHVTLDNLTLTDIFCSSQVILPQSGSILIAGGDNWTGTATTNTGNNNSNVFRYTDSTLSRGTNMNFARWYSSATVLMNGEVYIQGGNGGEYHPEVRQLDGTFRLLSDAHTSSYAATFPRNFLAPDGRVFGYDTAGRMYHVNPSGTGQLSAAGQFSPPYAGFTSSAAMFRPGRILQFGGNSNGAVIIDITGPQPVVTPTGSMSSRRQWVSATILADGRVLATGGSAVDNQLNDVNNSAEIWNPATGQWTVGPSGLRARLYHSGALLLPDASVLVTGGGAPGPLQNKHSEIYYPSYLYNSSGGFATRPVILTAPSVIEVGQDFQVGVGTADIRRLTLLKTGSVTHSVNMDQRFLELPFTASSGTLFVQMTDSFADAPPGYYMLFAFNQNGVPSRAKILRVNISASPIVLTDYTATIGGSGGQPYQLACNSDETLVGIYGNSAGTFVDRVGARCVQFDQSGRWIGDPVNRGATGSATGTAITRTCPRDMAVNGFRGRAESAVNQLTVSCRSVTTVGKVTGTTQFLTAVGGTGGLPQGPFSCTTDNPVYALTGRSGSWLDSVGMLCRQAPLTQTDTNVAPTVTNPGNQVGVVGVQITLPISASDGDGDTLSYSASGLPPGLAIATATGVISGTPTATGTHPVVITVSDGTASTTASFTWTITDAAPLVLDPMPLQPPRLAGTAITYTASAHNGINTEYHWQFDDGTESGWSASPSVTHTFAGPTVYWVTVTARDDRGTEQTQTFSQMIYLPLTATQPAVSTNIAVNAGRLWVVNQDDATVSVFSVSNNQKLAEIAVGAAPRALAFSPSGDVWVTNKQGASISVINPATLTVRSTLQLPRNSQPFGIVFAPNGSAAFVALEAARRVLRLDPVTGAELVAADVGGTPRHLSMKSDGSRLYAPLFVTPPLPGESTSNVVTQEGTTRYGGEIVVLDPGNLSILNGIVLRHSDDLDFEDQGSGVPNYLGPAVISPDGASAWVPSKKDNIKRGTLRSGGNLNFQNTVRAITSRIDLATGGETFGARIDHDNASLASASVFDQYGVYLFVALETSREVAVVDAHNHVQFFRINVGRAPQGLALSGDGRRLYVSNLMDRTVGVYDLTALIDQAQWNVPLLATLQSVSSENLSATVLKGKQFFYDARDTRLAREGYMSCASCHSDGGSDGRVWDLTGLSEGLRNTIELRGRAGMAHGFLHWSANFDEVQDFEGQIRALAAGTGLIPNAVLGQGTRNQPLGDPKAGLSADLDALAAYVASLNAFDGSPHRNADGSLTADGVAGKAVFLAEGCAQCHGGTNFSASGAATLFDVGTIHQPGSGTRLGASLSGLDPPTLRGIWRTAPYLHDGSALTLADAVRAHSAVDIGDGDLTTLVAYLRQIDGTEPAPPAANVPPTVTTPGAQSGTVGVPASLQIQAGDSDGGTLSYSASNLPAGLAINTASGLISGTPTTAQVRSVTVTVSDGQGGSATTAAFSWTIAAAANVPPTVTTPGAQSGTVGVPASLQIQAGDSDGGTLSYSASNLPAGLAINTASGLISGTPTTAQVRSVTVTVSDGQGGSATTAAFSWTISAAANVPPTVTTPGAQSGTVGVPASLQIQAGDSDGGTLSYSASNLPAGLGINATSGLISGTPTTAQVRSVTVTVSDGQGGSATTSAFSWTISAAANVPPTVTTPGAQSGTVGVPASLQIQAGDSDGGTLSYSASNLPAGLAINAASGLISGTPTTAQVRSVTVTVSDGQGGSATTNAFSWTISAAANVPPTVTTPGAQSGTVGVPASLQIQAGDSDGGTLSYSASNLPAGLGINATSGLISGTPTTAQVRSVTVTVSDGQGGSATTNAFSWTIGAVNVPPTITTPAAQSGIVGVPASLQIQAGDSDGGTLTYSASNLPAGLGINATSGLISGTPTTAQVRSVTVTVSDGQGGSATTNAFSWTIGAVNVPPTITTPAAQSGVVGVPASLQIQAGDSDGGTLTYSASNLPAGLGINAASGLISGTPTTAQVRSVTVTVSDGQGGSATTNAFSWTIGAVNVPPTITTPAAQSGIVGVPASLQIQAGDSDGGTLTYSASNLPAGLAINAASGLISGTPTTAQVRSVTVTVSDGQGGSATTNAFSWTIGAANVPPTITTPAAQSGIVGVLASLQIQAGDSDGGTLTYSASNLPAGLAINATSGLISGTPTTAQVRSVTVTVSDGQGGSATTNAFSWTIAPNQLPTAINPGNQSSHVGVAVSLQIAASDGDGDALSYSANSLPQGLAINSATGLITGTPTKAGNWNSSVSVRDAKGASTTVNFKWSVKR